MSGGREGHREDVHREPVGGGRQGGCSQGAREDVPREPVPAGSPMHFKHPFGGRFASRGRGRREISPARPGDLLHCRHVSADAELFMANPPPTGRRVSRSHRAGSLLSVCISQRVFNPVPETQQEGLLVVRTLLT